MAKKKGQSKNPTKINAGNIQDVSGEANIADGDIYEATLPNKSLSCFHRSPPRFILNHSMSAVLQGTRCSRKGRTDLFFGRKSHARLDGYVSHLHLLLT